MSTTAQRTEEILERGERILIETYKDMAPEMRARLLARSVLSGIDVDSPTMQALAKMVFADQGGE